MICSKHPANVISLTIALLVSLPPSIRTEDSRGKKSFTRWDDNILWNFDVVALGHAVVSVRHNFAGMTQSISVPLHSSPLGRLLIASDPKS